MEILNDEIYNLINIKSTLNKTRVNFNFQVIFDNNTFYF